MEKRFEKLSAALGDKIESVIDYEKIVEIRLTVNKPLQIVSESKKYFVGSKKLSIIDINEIFTALCDYSVHAYKNEICKGYITSEGGIRIGICGTAVYIDDKLSVIKEISALNIRIPHEKKGIAEEIIPFSEKGGILFIGPPCSGKTTFLRDFSRIASKEFFVTIVDERMEISGTKGGTPSFDIGNSTVLNGFIKSEGIKFAVRSMAPEIIVCDEFGDENDISSSFFAMKSGVKIVASMHSSDKNDLISKPLFKKILESGIFKTFVFLNKKHKICEITDAKDMIL